MDAALDDAEQCRVVALMGALAALGPAQRQLHRTVDDAFVGGRTIDVHRRAFVEDHHDVAAQHLLDMHRLLRPEEDLAAVGGRGEGDSGLGDLAPVRQREHLEAAGVGQDRPVPAGEAVQAAVRLDDLKSRPQEQVEGIAEDDLRAKRLDLRRQHALDRAIGADRHERRGFDGPARKADAAATGGAVRSQQFEIHAAHGANTCVLGRRARLPETPARLTRTSMFDAPPRAHSVVRPGAARRAFARLHRMRCKPSVLTHGALSVVPGRRTLLIVVVSRLMSDPARETAASHRRN